MQIMTPDDVAWGLAVVWRAIVDGARRFVAFCRTLPQRPRLRRERDEREYRETCAEWERFKKIAPPEPRLIAAANANRRATMAISLHRKPIT